MLRSFLSRHAHRLQVPTALLIALLQRTPFVRVAAQAETLLIDSPVGSVVRSVFAAAASLGAVQALAGATQFVVSPNPANGSVGNTLSVGITVTGAASPSGSFKIMSGTLPPGLSLVGATSSGYVNGSSAVITGTPTTAGTYSVLVRAWEFANGTGDSFPATLGYQVNFNISGATSMAPSFTTQPQNLTVNAGGFGTFVAAASGTPAPTYAWSRNGVAISGATNAYLTVSNVIPTDAGTYSVVASNSAGSITSSGATLTVNPVVGSPSTQGHIVNMSVLTNVDAGETVTFGYFLGGSGTSGTKPILMRGMGPSLTALGVGGVLSDPTIAFFTGSTQIAANNDWSGDPALSAAVAAVQAFPFASASSKDAAIFAQNVDASAGHSIKLSGVGAASGTALAELYDATPGSAYTTATPRLINVSLMKNVGTGTTLGFYIGGSTSVKVLIRAVGPTLATTFGLSGVMADPKMTLIAQGSSTVLASNDDWGTGNTADLQAAFQATGAFGLPANSKDAALLQTLQPGGYSVQVSAASGATGTAIIEVYEVP